ncbi:hypothetical protein ACFPT7_22980 [Acidicapsa dinghuensis]|uniref:Adenylate cyclase n=1 Tax=Acidicapsa dinghuensis TaxID=2218256 RepID=A0ABW1ELS0_9BACT|nr:hypothetical protein [Acidicapsa dinghuensis]
MAAAPPLPKSFEDAARQHLAVEAELERVCSSPHFRSSRRSCEFLRYIVQVTLSGRLDSLKERSIGIDLFGRDTSYEPSSDATVRVRANEVRKRLSSYYASGDALVESHSIRIELPTGTYIPRFIPDSIPLHPQAAPTQPETVHGTAETIAAQLPARSAVVPVISSLTLMRPALLALLLCTLLLRHKLENREEYLRFWDRLLSGRSALVLSVSPQDRPSLASSLYPLVWVAGRYGVDATMQSDSLTGVKPEALASVQVGYISSTEPGDSRLRWTITATPHETAATASQPADGNLPLLVDHRSSTQKGSALIPHAAMALLTILPEDPSLLHVQGTDAAAIRHLLEDLTVEHNFPHGLTEHFNSRGVLQVLEYRDTATGAWQRNTFWGDAQ